MVSRFSIQVWDQLIQLGVDLGIFILDFMDVVFRGEVGCVRACVSE